MKDLSVTVIARDEAEHIGECLRSVRQAAEIVVIDHFSSDATAQIARDCGAKVYQEPWRGFAHQKNSALDKASRPWILSLDADERVPPALWEEIGRVLGDEHAADGYFVPRRNYFCGKWIRHSGWYPDHTLRLFRKSAGRFEERAVHEKVVVRGKVGYLTNPLDHFTYRSVTDYLERLDRYSRLAALELSRKGRKPAWLSLLFRPAFTFLKMYLLKAGFLDGKPGFFLAVSYAYYTFLKYYRIDAPAPETTRPPSPPDAAS